MKFFLSFVMVLFLVLGGAYYFVNGTPSAVAPKDSLEYHNSAVGFSLLHPKDAMLNKQEFEGYLSATTHPVVGVWLPESFFEGTNLFEAGVFVGADSATSSLSRCYREKEGEAGGGSRDINGASFKAYSSNGAGAGNFYESKIYRSLRGNTCVEIVELLHSTNIGNYDSGTVKEFDREKFSKMLETIAQTFIFTEATEGILKGKATLGPVCPVERIPPDPRCAPRGVAEKFEVFEGSGMVVKTFESDADGVFSLSLPAGHYRIRKGESLGPMPTLKEVEVDIIPGVIVTLDLSLDSGIR